MKKSERFIAEFEKDFAERSQFFRMLGPGASLSLEGVGLDADIESGVVKPCISVRVIMPDGQFKLIKLHENYSIYDPEFDRDGELIEMLVDSLKLPESVICERLEKAGLLGEHDG